MVTIKCEWAACHLPWQSVGLPYNHRKGPKWPSAAEYRFAVIRAIALFTTWKYVTILTVQRYHWLVFSRFRRRRKPQCRASVGVSISGVRSWTASREREDVPRHAVAVPATVSDCTARPETLNDSGRRSSPEAVSGSTKFRSIGVTRLRRIASPESRIIATTFS